MNRRTLLACLPVVAVIAGSIGCARLTRSRFDMIYRGQPAEEVRDILGKPKYDLDETWVYESDWPYRKAKITFWSNRVDSKQWLSDAPKPRKTEQPATRPAAAQPAKG